MRVLGIETSCDDTAAAIYDREHGLLINMLAGQIIHNSFGGIVPELAARDHIKNLLPLIDHVITSRENAGQIPDAIAYTAGPGLAGALLVGASVATGLARAWGIPALGIHHMEGHLLAPMLEPEPPKLPLLALLVSGGHTMLVDVKRVGEYTILGQSRDDAAGEAFDKTAKLLGLGFPGGPPIAAAAKQGKPDKFTFARPMTNHAGFDFSFSGLKTAVRTTVMRCQNKKELDKQTIADIAYAFEEAVIDTLTIICLRALRHTQRTRLVLSGGVAANKNLRSRLQLAAGQLGVQLFYPRPELCTDNGAMIAYAGYMRLSRLSNSKLKSNINLADTNSADKFNYQFDIKPKWSIEKI